MTSGICGTLNLFSVDGIFDAISNLVGFSSNQIAVIHYHNHLGVAALWTVKNKLHFILFSVPFLALWPSCLYWKRQIYKYYIFGWLIDWLPDCMIVRVCHHHHHSSRISCWLIISTWLVTTWFHQAMFYSNLAHCYNQAASCRPAPFCRHPSCTALAMYYITRQPVSCEWTGPELLAAIIMSLHWS